MLLKCSRLSVVASVVLIGLSACNQPQKKVDEQVVQAPEADLPDMSIIATEEIDLVRDVLSHRAEYHRNLRRLRDYYGTNGFEMKRRWATFELSGLEKVRPYGYVEEHDVPLESLKPSDQDVGADALYDQGLDLMRQGGHGLPSPPKPQILAQAYRTFASMIQEHPSSDKIDDAAFQCAEILRQHFPSRQTDAVRWYERCFTWNPQTDRPARLRAAILYDYSLDNRDRALELYRFILDAPATQRSRMRFCMGRIKEITDQRSKATQAASGDIPTLAETGPAMFGSPTSSAQRKE